MTVTAEEITGIDLDSVPPCDTYMADGEQCGKPSAYRVKVTCGPHGTRYRFACGECLDWFKGGSGIMKCWWCREVLEWRVT